MQGLSAELKLIELTSATKGLAISPDSEKTSKERADLFYSFVKHRRDQNVLAEISTQKDILRSEKSTVIVHRTILLQKLSQFVRVYSVKLPSFWYHKVEKRL